MNSSIQANSEASTARSRRGQTLVEFALILPLLLVLLLGIADFGRVFAAGIIVEAAARDAAEAAAQEYLQVRRDATPTDSTDYDRIHALALQTVCEEALPLPNRVEGGGSCTMPAAAVCIHDFAAELPGYTTCGTEATAAPGNCSRIRDGWPDTTADEPPPDMLPYVEVRVCYQFTTLFNLVDLSLPMNAGISVGEVWLQRDRTFTVAAY